MTSPDPSTSRSDRQLAVLRQTFPGWDIIRKPSGMWGARRAAAPTPAQAAQGLHRYIVQPGAEALAAVLTQQLSIYQGIQHRFGD